MLVGAAVTPGTDLVNTATVTGVDEDPNPPNNVATATTGTTTPPPLLPTAAVATNQLSGPFGDQNGAKFRGGRD